MNINQICMKCMTGNLNEDGKCSNCGANSVTEKNGNKHLPVKTILKGKYLVGRVIGEGGFGITYIGYDLDLEIRVAIKEFCPKHSVERDIEDGLTIYPYSESAAEEFEREKEKFINEARRLAKFRNEGGVVSVLDYFIENGTAYIVMDYIDGITLKSYLKTLRDTTGRNMNMAGVLNLFKPVMETLAKIHKSGIIHRDISPENIMISKDFTKVYLIDFGTARDMENGHTLSEYYKGFYSPIEQRSSQSKGKMEQGPWTDVYALCATIYVCITGRVMSDSVSRLVEDDLIRPSKFGIDILSAMEDVLVKGLAVKPQDRIRSMEELMQAFYGENETVKPAVRKEVSNVNAVAAKPKTIETNETRAVNNNCRKMYVRNEEFEQEKQICKLAVARLERHHSILDLGGAIVWTMIMLFMGYYGVDPFYWIWLIAVGFYYIFIISPNSLLAKKKRIFLPNEPSVRKVLLQIEVMKGFWVLKQKNKIIGHFKERSEVNWDDYKAQCLVHRYKLKHVIHRFFDAKIFKMHIFRHELINYYNTVIIPSNLPEELKAEWKQAAIDSWVIIED